MVFGMQGIERDQDGAVAEMRGELHLEGDVKSTKCACWQGAFLQEQLPHCLERVRCERGSYA